MARTKGAKGKKTLAKEKGMTLEQYLEYERNTALEKIIGAESINQILNSELKTLNKNKEENKEENKEQIKEEDKNPEPVVQELKKEELTLELTVDEKDLKDLKDVKNPEPTITTEDSEIKIKTKKKKEKEIIYCERCHKPITGNIPFKINLTYLTTVPAYHRQTPSDRVQLCYKCIDDLNGLIDKWLWDEGKGLPLKYGATVMIN